MHSSLQGQKPGVLSGYRNGWAFSHEAARWARSTVWSRSFTVHRLRRGDKTVGPVVALIPVLDMIDHSPDVEVVWHTGPDGKGDFQFCPVSPIKKASEPSVSSSPPLLSPVLSIQNQVQNNRLSCVPTARSWPLSPSLDSLSLVGIHHLQQLRLQDQ